MVPPQLVSTYSILRVCEPNAQTGKLKQKKRTLIFLWKRPEAAAGFDLAAAEATVIPAGGKVRSDADHSCKQFLTWLNGRALWRPAFPSQFLRPALRLMCNDAKSETLSTFWIAGFAREHMRGWLLVLVLRSKRCNSEAEPFVFSCWFPNHVIQDPYGCWGCGLRLPWGGNETYCTDSWFWG